MDVVLEDNELKEFIDHDTSMAPTSDAKYLVEWNKCVAKVRRIILEGVQDHIFLNFHGKETSYVMWQSLYTCFKNAMTIGSWH